MLTPGQGANADVVLASPQLLRRTNMAAVLQHAWDVESFTASEAMVATGLTRSTVLRQADDLVALGWLHELDGRRDADQRVKGRPARCYAFRPRAAHVLGVDAGQHRGTACVADLRGNVLARATRPLDPAGDDRGARVALLDEAVTEALRSVGADGTTALVTVIGVPAPADEHGRSPSGHDGFWARMNAGLADALDRGRTVVVDNDANLAAIAEGSVGEGVGVSSFVTLLSGERFGAGLIVDGSLLRGRHGGAGEMHLLDLVDGVGSADGLGALARDWAREAVRAGQVPETSVMRRRAPEEPELVDVLDAAQRGEPAALAIVERLAERLARVCAVLAGLLDVDRIIVAGAMAPTAGPVIARAATKIAPHAHLPVPQVVASTLGADSVNIGAIHKAISIVRGDPLGFDLPTRHPEPSAHTAATSASA